MNKWNLDSEDTAEIANNKPIISKRKLFGRKPVDTKPKDKRKCWRITIEPSIRYQYIYVYGNSHASIHTEMGNDETGTPPTIELYGNNFSLEFDDHVLEEVEEYKIPPRFDRIPF